MSFTFRRGVAVAGACAMALAVVAAGSASADQPGPAAAPAKSLTAAPASLLGANPPRGYTVVTSALLASRPGSQTRGAVACPGTKVPLGGGAFIVSGETTANINSSFPFAQSWVVDVNNATTSQTSFTVFAVCAHKPKGYSIQQSATIQNPAGSQSTGFAACPIGTKPLGGGALSNTGSTSVNTNSTLPVSTSWRVDMNNASTQAATFDVIVVCGKLKGYTVVNGDQFETPAFRQARGTATCPAPTVPLGGGVFAGSDTAVNLNSSIPSGNDWVVFENNGSAGNGTALAVVACAGL